MTGREKARRVYKRTQRLALLPLGWLAVGGYALHSILGDQLVTYFLIVGGFLLLAGCVLFYWRARYRCPYCRTYLGSVLGHGWFNTLTHVQYFPCCRNPVDKDLPPTGNKV